MRKTFVLNWSKNNQSKVNFSYPDFKKEGLAAFFPILDWVSNLTFLVFAVLVFFVKSTNLSSLIYVSATILFAVQLMKTVLGGFSYFPKTKIDVGGLLFVAFSIVAILVSNTQEVSLFGEGKLSFLSGMSSFALLLISYSIIATSFLNGSYKFVKKAVGVSLVLLSFKLFVDRDGLLTKEISSSFYLPIALPILFFTLLQSKGLTKKIIILLTLVATLFVTNFNDFSFSFSLMVSLMILFFILLLGGSEFLYESIVKIGTGIGSMFKKKISLIKFLKVSGSFLVGAIGFFVVFIISIIRTVENFSNDFTRVLNVYKDVWAGFDGTKEIIFGKGLDSLSGSFYADVLNSFGIVGLVGFLLLVILALIYVFKILKKSYKEKNSRLSILLLGILTSFLTLLIYLKLESVTIYGYLLLWFLLILIGTISTVEMYKNDAVLETVVGLKGAKRKTLFVILKLMGILIVAVVAIIFLYLILR